MKCKPGSATLATSRIETAWARRRPLLANNGTTFAGFFSSALGAYLVGYGALDSAIRHPEGDTYATPDGWHLVVTERQFYDPMTQIQHNARHLTFLQPGDKSREKTLRVALRYVFPQEMEALLFYNGLQIRTCNGNWQQEPLTATSPAMIYVCHRRV